MLKRGNEIKSPTPINATAITYFFMLFSCWMLGSKTAGKWVLLRFYHPAGSNSMKQMRVKLMLLIKI